MDFIDEKVMVERSEELSGTLTRLSDTNTSLKIKADKGKLLKMCQ